MTETHQNPVERAVGVFVLAPLGAALRVLEATPALIESCIERGQEEVAHRHAQVTQQVTNARGMGEFTLSYGVPKLLGRVTKRLEALRNRVGGNHVTSPATGSGSRTAPAPSPERAGDGPSDHAPQTSTAGTPARPKGTPIVVSEPTSSNGEAADAGAAQPDDLPIPGYDALSASQVVQRLSGLADDELDAVRGYEAAHRNRRTILGKIEQLATPSA